MTGRDCGGLAVTLVRTCVFSLLVLLVAAVCSVAGAASADQDVQAKTDTGSLWGTWLAPPQAPIATVLILAGSGPTDRNGNGPSIHPDSLRLLANELAARGIASLRVDKRGIGASAPAGTVESDLRFQTYSNDTRAWVKFLLNSRGA